jgi:hypothetical protein
MLIREARWVICSAGEGKHLLAQDVCDVEDGTEKVVPFAGYVDVVLL